MKITQVLLFILLHSNFIAQQYSQIEGFVKDPISGEPLIGASVILLNTNYGAATDINGHYKVENVRFGRYILKCSYTFYSTVIDSVQINEYQQKIKKDYFLRYLGIPQIVYEKDLLIKGYYISSFEYSGIIPCDSVRPFWVEGSEDFYNKYSLLMEEMKINELPGGSKYNPTKVYCILNGCLSKKGRYGQAGGYEYQFKVNEIIIMKKPSDSDCKEQ